MTKKKEIRKKINEVKTIAGPQISRVKKTICTRGCCLNAAKTVGLVLFYYTFSISLTFYNKSFISHFKFPLCITLVHLITKFILAGIVRNIIEMCSGERRVILGWWDYIKRVAPPGITGSLDIGLSNWSFEFITVSLYTMTKSTVIIFILAFSLLFRLEKPKVSLIGIVLLISIGLFMFTYHSTQFHLTGFLLVLFASFLSGLRWTMAQLVLQKSELGLANPVDMMYHIQPWMILTLLPLAVGFEGLHLSTSELAFNYQDVDELAVNTAILMAGAGLAFMLELSEFLLVFNTSGLALSIAGVFKEICTLVLAVLINGDVMNSINALGLVVCLLGITLHVFAKAMYVAKVTSSVRRESLMNDLNLKRLVTKVTYSVRRESLMNDLNLKRLVGSKENSTEDGEAMEMLLSNGGGLSENDSEAEEDDEEIFNIIRDR